MSELAERLLALAESLDGNNWDHPITACNDCRQAAEVIQAIDRGGMDISPCLECGLPVVCIPDGMPLCEACATKDDELRAKHED